MWKANLRVPMVLLGLVSVPALLRASASPATAPAAPTGLWARAGSTLIFTFAGHEQAFLAVRINGGPVAFAWIPSPEDPVAYHISVPLDTPPGMAEFAVDTAHGVTVTLPMLILPPA